MIFFRHFKDILRIYNINEQKKKQIVSNVSLVKKINYFH